ncbi:MAG: hypothetical protein VB055_04720 [Oscillospiraceae bacterium]|nr:hypothetical protein [Oscillospiraceae bacterium]
MLNKKLYSRIYKDNPGDPLHPIYVGGHYEKQSGLPARRFRLLGLACSALCFFLLLGAGLRPSAASRVMYSVPFYAAAFLPAVLCLAAFLQSPGDDAPIREDAHYYSFARIQSCSAIGMGLTALAFLGGGAASIAAGSFSGMTLLYEGLLLAAFFDFFLLRRLWRGQVYVLRTDPA